MVGTVSTVVSPRWRDISSSRTVLTALIAGRSKNLWLLWGDFMVTGAWWKSMFRLKNGRSMYTAKDLDEAQYCDLRSLCGSRAFLILSTIWHDWRKISCVSPSVLSFPASGWAVKYPTWCFLGNDDYPGEHRIFVCSQNNGATKAAFVSYFSPGIFPRNCYQDFAAARLPLLVVQWLCSCRHDRCSCDIAVRVHRLMWSKGRGRTRARICEMVVWFWVLAERDAHDCSWSRRHVCVHRAGDMGRRCRGG